MTAPTIEWVVDTGELVQVAKLSHSEEASSAAIIANEKTCGWLTMSGSRMPSEMVSMTSPPAIRAPAISKTAASISATGMEMARAPTAAPTLLVTSLAPMFIAM